MRAQLANIAGARGEYGSATLAGNYVEDRAGAALAAARAGVPVPFDGRTEAAAAYVPAAPAAAAAARGTPARALDQLPPRLLLAHGTNLVVAAGPGYEAAAASHFETTAAAATAAVAAAAAPPTARPAQYHGRRVVVDADPSRGGGVAAALLGDIAAATGKRADGTATGNEGGGGEWHGRRCGFSKGLNRSVLTG
jgi:hypothetical protein